MVAETGDAGPPRPAEVTRVASGATQVALAATLNALLTRIAILTQDALTTMLELVASESK